MLMLRWFVFRFDILAYPDFALLYFLSAVGFFLLAPLLYLSIKSLCYKDFSLTGKSLWHLMPALFFIIFTLIQYELQSPTTDPDAVPTIWEKIFIVHYWRIFRTSNLVQILGYILAMVYTVMVYQKRLERLYSAVERINLNWLKALFTVIILHWLFITTWALMNLFNYTTRSVLNVLDLFSIVIFLVFTTWLVLKGLTQLKLFAGIEERVKYGHARLADLEQQSIARQLKNYMAEYTPYLEPNLTIEDLSAALSVQPWQLSQVINDEFQQNFFNFINSYRIEEAKQKFREPTYRKTTILEILYESGFNSKSTFNSVFKKYTGMTPTKFKASWGAVVGKRWSVVVER